MRREALASRFPVHVTLKIRADAPRLRSHESRKVLIDCLYAVAAADDQIARVEDVEVRRIADALLVAWSEVLKLRAPYRDKLEELRLLRGVREVE